MILLICYNCVPFVVVALNVSWATGSHEVDGVTHTVYPFRLENFTLSQGETLLEALPRAQERIDLEVTLNPNIMQTIESHVPLLTTETEETF